MRTAPQRLLKLAIPLMNMRQVYRLFMLRKMQALHFGDVRASLLESHFSPATQVLYRSSLAASENRDETLRTLLSDSFFDPLIKDGAIIRNTADSVLNEPRLSDELYSKYLSHAYYLRLHLKNNLRNYLMIFQEAPPFSWIDRLLAKLERRTLPRLEKIITDLEEEAGFSIETRHDLLEQATRTLQNGVECLAPLPANQWAAGGPG
jgi:hypothetical protein